MQVQRLIETITSPHLFIDLPKSFLNHRVEILILTLDDPQPVNSGKKRIPPPQFTGRVKELGDVMSSVPPADWGILTPVINQFANPMTDTPMHQLLQLRSTVQTVIVPSFPLYMYFMQSR